MSFQRPCWHSSLLAIIPSPPTLRSNDTGCHKSPISTAPPFIPNNCPSSLPYRRLTALLLCTLTINSKRGRRLKMREMSPSQAAFIGIFLTFFGLPLYIHSYISTLTFASLCNILPEPIILGNCLIGNWLSPFSVLCHLLCSPFSCLWSKGQYLCGILKDVSIPKTHCMDRGARKKEAICRSYEKECMRVDRRRSLFSTCLILYRNDIKMDYKNNK